MRRPPAFPTMYDQAGKQGTVRPMTSTNSGDLWQPPTPEELAQWGFEWDEIQRRGLASLNAKLRTYPHPDVANDPVLLAVGTHPPFEECAALAAAALSNPAARTRSKAPRRWPPKEEYAGVLLLCPFENRPAAGPEDFGLLQRDGIPVDESIRAGFGWIEHRTGRLGSDPTTVWIEDPGRRFESALLNIISRDPLAKLQLDQVFPSRRGFPPAVPTTS